MNSVEQSRRTIFLITENFLDSHWCMHELRAAQTESFHERRRRLIVITHDGIEKSAKIGEELKAYLRMHLYIKFEDPRFWSKLRYAMPHKGETSSDDIPMDRLKIMTQRREF